MKKILLLLTMVIIAVTLLFSSGCKNSTEPEITIPDTTGGPVVRKPNLYLYPTSVCSLSVKIEFPLGGSIVESEPYYYDGWYVKVDPSGKINEEYDYLYYEAQCPEVYQYDYGWSINRDSLFNFFTNNLLATGFNESEKNDFIEYWIPILTDYEYYAVFPQYSAVIEKIIQLKFSIYPDNILRLFYVIEGFNSEQMISPPQPIPYFDRNGFVVTEWGVILK